MASTQASIAAKLITAGGDQSFGGICGRIPFHLRANQSSAWFRFCRGSLGDDVISTPLWFELGAGLQQITQHKWVSD